VPIDNRPNQNYARPPVARGNGGQFGNQTPQARMPNSYQPTRSFNNTNSYQPTRSFNNTNSYNYQSKKSPYLYLIITIVVCLVLAVVGFFGGWLLSRANTAPNAVLSAPKSLTLDVVTESVYWNTVDGASEYIVIISTIDQDLNEYAQEIETKETKCSFAKYTESPDTYFFRVMAKKGDIKSGFSDTCTFVRN